MLTRLLPAAALLLLLPPPAWADRDGAFAFQSSAQLFVLNGQLSGDTLEHAGPPWTSRVPESVSLGLDEGAEVTLFNYLGPPKLRLSPFSERAVVVGSYGRIFDIDSTGLTRVPLPTDDRAYAFDAVFLPNGSPMAAVATETVYGGVAGLSLWQGPATRGATWQELANSPGQACSSLVALALDSGNRPVLACGPSLFTTSTAGTIVPLGVTLDGSQFAALHLPGPVTFFEAITGTGATLAVKRVQETGGSWTRTLLSGSGLVNSVPTVDTITSQRFDAAFISGLDPVGNHVLVAVTGTGGAATVETVTTDLDARDLTAAAPDNTLVAAGSYRLRVWEKGSSGWNEHFLGSIGEIDCTDCCQCRAVPASPDFSGWAAVLSLSGLAGLSVVRGRRRG